MLGFFSAVFAFVITLFPLIIIHELGHYWMARIFGVHVMAFSIGYGPEIVGWTDKRGTRWKIAPFPLGGYVQILGEQEDAPAQASVSSKMLLQDPKRTLASKAPWQKILIAAAGPLSNYLTAFLLFLGLSMTLGSSIYEPILGPVKSNSLAETAGLKEGDRIVSVQGVLIKEFKEILSVLEKTPLDESLSFVIVRPGQENPLILKIFSDVQEQKDQPIEGEVSKKESFAGESVTAVLKVNEEKEDKASESAEEKIQRKKEGSIAAQDSSLEMQKSPSWREKIQITPSAYYKMNGQPLSFSHALDETWQKITILSEAPLNMIKKAKLDGMSGPLGIAQQAQMALNEGFSAVLLFMGILSVGLGLLNLLPIPMLDGGAILITLIEALLGKSLPSRLHNVIAFTAIAFLGGLFLFFSWNDVMRILG